MSKSLNPEESVYFVYALLDPRKRGTFKYGKTVFDHEPFYIGKGSKNRHTQHIRMYKRRGDNAKKSDFALYSYYRMYCKIRKIKRDCGRLPIVEIVYSGITEAKAFKREESLVNRIGRHDLGEGPLINRHDGGLGGKSRQACSKRTRKKISENSKAMHAARSDSEKKKISRVISTSNRRRWNLLDEVEKESRRRVSRTVFARKSEKEMTEIRKRMSEGRKRYFANLTDEQRAENSARLRAGAAKGWEKRRQNNLTL